MVFFAVLTLLLFGFALGADTEALKAASAGVLWLTVLFSGVLVFNRSYQTELETGALEILLLYPGERWSIFAGKLLANLAFVLLVEDRDPAGGGGALPHAARSRALRAWPA